MPTHSFMCIARACAWVQALMRKALKAVEYTAPPSAEDEEAPMPSEDQTDRVHQADPWDNSRNGNTWKGNNNNTGKGGKTWNNNDCKGRPPPNGYQSVTKGRGKDDSKVCPTYLSRM